MASLITLTTDFGVRDPYVAAMKGVILSRCRRARVFDLTHDIAPQNVLECALFLVGCAPYWPQNTIHCIVVDPRVGTDRRAVAARIGRHYYVCPDNGVLTLLMRDHKVSRVHEITNRSYMRETISATFHGRDVFAPTAASLADGVPIDEIGGPIDDLCELDIPAPEKLGENGIRGHVIHIDRFGNCITNIHRSQALSISTDSARIGNEKLPFCNTYADVASGAPLALFGSADFLEVAVNRGSAHAELGVKIGDAVEYVV